MASERKKPKIDLKFTITATVVVEYARISREFLEVEAQRDSLNANIKAAMARGQTCPLTTPYKLVVLPQMRCKYSWKQITAKLILALPARARAAATALVARLQMDKVECPTLEVVPNRMYRPPVKRRSMSWAKK